MSSTADSPIVPGSAELMIPRNAMSAILPSLSFTSLPLFASCTTTSSKCGAFAVTRLADALALPAMMKMRLSSRLRQRIAASTIPRHPNFFCVIARRTWRKGLASASEEAGGAIRARENRRSALQRRGAGDLRQLCLELFHEVLGGFARAALVHQRLL